MGSISGRMAGFMSGNINLIRNMDMERILGLTVVSTQESGLIANDMDEVKLSSWTVAKEKAFGKKIGELDGLMNLQEPTPKYPINTDISYICPSYNC